MCYNTKTQIFSPSKHTLKFQVSTYAAKNAEQDWGYSSFAIFPFFTLLYLLFSLVSPSPYFPSMQAVGPPVGNIP